MKNQIDVPKNATQYNCPFNKNRNSSYSYIICSNYTTLIIIEELKERLTGEKLIDYY
jgi:hypothetical protein